MRLRKGGQLQGLKSRKGGGMMTLFNVVQILDTCGFSIKASGKWGILMVKGPISVSLPPKSLYSILDSDEVTSIFQQAGII